jgi:hypothetical protein
MLKWYLKLGAKHKVCNVKQTFCGWTCGREAPPFKYVFHYLSAVALNRSLQYNGRTCLEISRPYHRTFKRMGFLGHWKPRVCALLGRYTLASRRAHRWMTSRTSGAPEYLPRSKSSRGSSLEVYHHHVSMCPSRSRTFVNQAEQQATWNHPQMPTTI